MQNPWGELPADPPYILECDRVAVEQFNQKRKSDQRYSVGGEAFPEPFLGSPDAPIVLLSGNPGSYPHLDPLSAPFYRKGHPLLDVARKNLLHEPLAYPFWTLDPQFDGYPGHRWWTKRFNSLLWLGIDRRRISQRVLCVEFFPYHTQNVARFPLLQSQRYGFDIVDRAVTRGAIILIMRMKRPWLTNVASLNGYLRLYELSNIQNPCVSPAQVTSDAWEQVLDAIR